MRILFPHLPPVSIHLIIIITASQLLPPGLPSGSCPVPVMTMIEEVLPCMVSHPSGVSTRLSSRLCNQGLVLRYQVPSQLDVIRLTHLQPNVTAAKWHSIGACRIHLQSYGSDVYICICGLCRFCLDQIMRPGESFLDRQGPLLRAD